MNVILCNGSALICFQMLGKHVRMFRNISVSAFGHVNKILLFDASV